MRRTRELWPSDASESDQPQPQISTKVLHLTLAFRLTKLIEHLRHRITTKVIAQVDKDEYKNKSPGN